MKRIINVKTLVIFVFLTFAASAIYAAVGFAAAFADPALPEQDIGAKTDYVLILLQCIVGMLVMLLPGFLKRKAGIDIPSGMIIAFAAFLYCAIYLGEVHNFYFRIPHWDTLLHTFSGAALGAIGLSLISLLNKSKSVQISPLFAALFAFCFAVAAGTVWEIYEFSMDCLLGTNMQKFMLENGEMLIGQSALADTMKDIIVDSIGALTVSIVSYISMKHGNGWPERMQLRKLGLKPVQQSIAQETVIQTSVLDQSLST